MWKVEVYKKEEECRVRFEDKKDVLCKKCKRKSVGDVEESLKEIIGIKIWKRVLFV